MVNLTSCAVEMKISYLSIDGNSVEYIINEDFADYHEAKYQAPQMVKTAYEDAYDDNGLMFTFYYEYDFIMDQQTAESTGLKYTMEA